MQSFVKISKCIVLKLTSDTYKPFYHTRGPIIFDPITLNNINDVTDSFHEGKISVSGDIQQEIPVKMES